MKGVEELFRFKCPSIRGSSFCHRAILQLYSPLHDIGMDARYLAYLRSLKIREMEDKLKKMMDLVSYLET